MSHRPRIATLAVIVALSLIAAVAGCGDKSTNPGGGMKELNSGNIASGGQFQHTFANPGTYGYHCAIHGTVMSGSVTVGSGSGNAAVAIGDNFYNPANVSVPTGATVTWTNNGITHTVTSN